MNAMPLQPDVMGTAQDFTELMAQVRAGSKAAMHSLIEVYGHHLLRAVRVHMHRKLRTKFDSCDFVQDVWASVFIGLTGGRAFGRPEELVAFLTRVAGNKVASAVRQRLMSKKYNVNREYSLDDSAVGPPPEPAARQPTPSQVAMGREEWERVLHGQPPAYRLILMLLRDGRTAAQVAQETNVSERTVQRLIDRLLPGFRA